MTETEIHKNHTAGGLIKAFMITLPFLALNVLIHLDFSGGSLIGAAAGLISIIFMSAMLFLMVYTNKTDRYRAILFIVVGLSFILSFAAGFYEEHGRFMVFTAGDVVAGNVSYCPIAIPNTIAAMILGRILAFPSGVGGALMMLLIVAGVMLFGGRSWCGWHCFFAGIEEGMSRCRKKAAAEEEAQQELDLFFFCHSAYCDDRFSDPPFALLLRLDVPAKSVYRI